MQTSSPPPSRRAPVIWLTGLTCYVIAVLQRTSFGVAAIDAVARYQVSASLLAGFVVLQLVMYAGLQVPVGLALDRFGSRRLIAAGALVMAAGQLVLAVSPDIGLAYAGRALVGAGDAATFISVLRLVPAWFPARRVPVLTQLTGMVGAGGQILSAVPLLALLHARGWTVAFATAAALGLLFAALALLVVRDAPAGASGRPENLTGRRLAAQLRTVWRHPGTRLGLWTHFSTQFPGTVFALMWGYPFLVAGEGASPRAAGLLLTEFVLVGAATGPVVGVLVQRHPLRRSWLVLSVIALNVAGWTAVLVWPGTAPIWLLAVLVAALGTGVSGSMIGFDFARSFTPPNRLGTATGIVNVGGFVASLLVILLIGMILDLRTHGAGGYRLADFKVAVGVHYLFWLVGVIGVLTSRRRIRRRLAAGVSRVPALR